jgi:hypothetical protein
MSENKVRSFTGNSFANRLDGRATMSGIVAGHMARNATSNQNSTFKKLWINVHFVAQVAQVLFVSMSKAGEVLCVLQARQNSSQFFDAVRGH